MEKYQWIMTALAGLVPLAMSTIADLEAKGEMTGEQAQAERERIHGIWQQEYAKTDAQRGRV
jgi:hypothetical protein